MTGPAAGGFRVDLAALAQYSDGLDRLVAELGELGASGEVDNGTALTHLELSAEEIGHADLADPFTEVIEQGRFLLRNGLGVLLDAREKLTDTRSWYEKAEQGALDLFHRIDNDLLGVFGKDNTTAAAKGTHR